MPRPQAGLDSVETAFRGCGAVRRPFPLLLVLLEAALAAAIVGTLAGTDRQNRSTGPESPVAAYVAAVAREDLAGALDQLLPELQEGAAPFVGWELGNRYTILESAVRTVSLLDRLAGKAVGSPTVVVTLEIQGEAGARWRATEELPVGFAEGRWYLQKPPLQPQR